MKTQTILDEFREKFDKTTSFGGFEVEYAGCEDPCCGGCTEKLDEDLMIAFLKEKLEQVERDMIEKIKGIGLRLALTDDDVVSDAHITGQEEMKNRIINSLKEEKV